MSFKIMLLKVLQHLPGVNEFKYNHKDPGISSQYHGYPDDGWSDHVRVSAVMVMI